MVKHKDTELPITDEEKACPRQVWAEGRPGKYVVQYACGARRTLQLDHANRHLPIDQVRRRVTHRHDHILSEHQVAAAWAIIELGKAGDAYRCGRCGMSFERWDQEVKCMTPHAPGQCCHLNDRLLPMDDPRRGVDRAVWMLTWPGQATKSRWLQADVLVLDQR